MGSLNKVFQCCIAMNFSVEFLLVDYSWWWEIINSVALHHVLECKTEKLISILVGNLLTGVIFRCCKICPSKTYVFFIEESLKSNQDRLFALVLNFPSCYVWWWYIYDAKKNLLLDCWATQSRHIIRSILWLIKKSNYLKYLIPITL